MLFTFDACFSRVRGQLFHASKAQTREQAGYSQREFSLMQHQTLSIITVRNVRRHLRRMLQAGCLAVVQVTSVRAG